MQNRQPFVSVICSVYNTAAYLPQCLDSLLTQTLKEIEIICINDGSTDNSLEILQKYAAKDSRISVVSKPNGGAASARNLGITLAKGQYLHFADSDDFLEPDMLENMFRKATEHNVDIVLSPSGVVKKGRMKKSDKSLKIRLLPKAPFKPEQIADKLFQVTNSTAWNKLFKRSFIMDKNLRFQDLKSCNDIGFVYVALTKAASIDYVEKLGYWYRQDAAGAISRRRAQLNECVYDAMKFIRCHLENSGFWDIYQKTFYAKTADVFASEFHQIKDIRERFRKIEKYSSFLPPLYHHKLFKHFSSYLRYVVLTFLEKHFRFLMHYHFRKKYPTQRLVAINIPAPRKKHNSWGDYWLAKDLKSALAKRFCVFLNFKENYNSYYNKFNDVMLTIAGLYLETWKPRPGQINVAWVISHFSVKFPENIDLVACASQKYTKYLLEHGTKAIYIPQFTNVDRFYPQTSTETRYHHKLLFIGNSRGIYRDCVKYAVEHKLPLSLFGKGWWKYPVSEVLKGEYISNDELNLYYSNADIVLNDHYEHMRAEGFISNRIFDVTACKGFIISDYMPEIEEIYGDSIPMYKNEAQFVELIRYYLEHPQERREKAQKAHEITLAHFTADHVGTTLMEEIDMIWKQR